MPVKKMLAKDIPRGRFQWSPLYDTREWKDAVKAAKTMKPHEALEIELSQETLTSLPLQKPYEAMFIGLRRWIRRNKLSIDVQKRIDFGGVTKIYMRGRPVKIT